MRQTSLCLDSPPKVLLVVMLKESSRDQATSVGRHVHTLSFHSGWVIHAVGHSGYSRFFSPVIISHKLASPYRLYQFTQYILFWKIIYLVCQNSRVGQKKKKNYSWKKIKLIINFGASTLLGYRFGTLNIGKTREVLPHTWWRRYQGS